MKLRSLKHYVNEAFINLFRNSLMTLASIVTVFSCIFMLAFSYCIVINIDFILKEMEGTLNVSAYIYDDLSDQEVKTLYGKIQTIEHVETVDFINKAEALIIFQEMLGESDDSEAGIDELSKDNPLPRSFVITTDKVEYQDEVVTQLEKLKGFGIHSIQYDQGILNLMTSVNNAIRIMSVVLILILLGISIVIIMNTIKITVNSRRIEITIMKYIGATDWFIRWPFIIEGILIGIISSFIAATLCWFGYSHTINALDDQLRMINDVFKSDVEVFAVLFPLCIVVGIGIGVVGSVNSIRKHLKV